MLARAKLLPTAVHDLAMYIIHVPQLAQYWVHIAAVGDGQGCV